MPPRADLILIALAVAMLSTSGPLIRYAVSSGAPSMSVAMWRNSMACLVIVPLALATRREELRAMLRRDVQLCIAAGLILAVHFATWVPSVGYTSVASATALVATQPVWAALIARAGGERVRRAGWVGILVAVLGAAVLSGVDLTISARSAWGDVLAIAGGITAGAYVAIGGSIRQRVSTTAYTAICYSTAALVLLTICVAGRQPLTGYTAPAWWSIVALTVGAQLFGHTVFNHVLKTTSPTFVSMSILLEVAGSALLAGIFFDEWPPVAAIPAAALIVGGIVMVLRAGTKSAVARVPVLD